jgi:prevent-host-death family protein
MRVVGLKVLKNRLSEYVRIAAAGERVLVTDRDRVVAELVPPQAGTAEYAGDAVLAEAVRSGWLRPPVLPTGSSPPRLPVMTMRELMADLDRDRGDR